MNQERPRALPGENGLKAETWQLATKQDPRLDLDPGKIACHGLFQGNWQNVIMDCGSDGY